MNYSIVKYKGKNKMRFTCCVCEYQFGLLEYDTDEKMCEACLENGT